MEEFFSQGKPIKVLNSYHTGVLSPDPMMGTMIVFDLGRLVQGYPELEFTAPKGYTIEIGYAQFLTEGKFNPIVTWGQFGDKVISSREAALNRMIAEAYYRKKDYQNAVKYFKVDFEKATHFTALDKLQAGHAYHNIQEFENTIRYLEPLEFSADSSRQFVSYY